MPGQLGVKLVPRPSHAVRGYAPAPHNLAPQGLGYGPLRPPRSAPGSTVVLRPAIRPSVAGTRPKGCPPTRPDHGVFEEVDDAFDAALDTFSGGSGGGRGRRKLIRYGDEPSSKDARWDSRWDGCSEDEEEAISAGRWRNRGGGRSGGRGKGGRVAGGDGRGRSGSGGVSSEVLEDPWAELVATVAPHLRAHLDGLVDDLESEEEVDEAKARKEAEEAKRCKEDLEKLRRASEEPEPSKETADKPMRDPALELELEASAAADDAGAAGEGTSIYDFFHDDDDAMV